MIQITQPSRELLNNVDPQDIFSFMTHLIQEITMNPKGEDMRVFVNRIEHFDTRNGSSLMTNVKISFQIFNENNVEYRSVWRAYRAKDFICSNSSLDPIVEYVRWSNTLQRLCSHKN